MYKVKGLYKRLSSKLPPLLDRKGQSRYKMLYGSLYGYSEFIEEGVLVQECS